MHDLYFGGHVIGLLFRFQPVTVIGSLILRAQHIGR